jgi:hypothetical protein
MTKSARSGDSERMRPLVIPEQAQRNQRVAPVIFN